MPHLAGDSDHDQGVLASRVIRHLVWLFSVMADMTTSADRYYIAREIFTFLDAHFDVFAFHENLLRNIRTRLWRFAESACPEENAIHAEFSHLIGRMDTALCRIAETASNQPK